MIHTPHSSHPNHDPIADILSDNEELTRGQGLDRAANTADRDRFMKAVQTATRILNRHPNTQEHRDETDANKPMTKTVDDEVDLPKGPAHVWLSFGPASENYNSL